MVSILLVTCGSRLISKTFGGPSSNLQPWAKETLLTDAIFLRRGFGIDEWRLRLWRSFQNVKNVLTTFDDVIVGWRFHKSSKNNENKSFVLKHNFSAILKSSELCLCQFCF